MGALKNIRTKAALWLAPDYQYNMPTDQQKKQSTRDVDSYIARIQFARVKSDVQSWREAIVEAELPLWMHRVKMQRIYQDTVLNGHVAACLQKRNDLTLLRDFCFYEGDNEVDGAEKIIRTEWFYQMMEYILAAKGYGYSLVGFGDIVNGLLPKMELIRRWNVSPDRLNVVSIPYAMSGINFGEDGTKDESGESFYEWTAWIPTPTENGVSKCGYGFLYKVALYEIFLRQNLSFNADFIELYAQPYRVGKTTKSDEAERFELEAALRDMGSSGYAIIDPTDSIEFLETALGGTGWKGYADFELRVEKKITKIILGHADAMDSVPGKLGAQQGEDNPIERALSNVAMTDGRFVENVLNKEVFPKLRNLGMPIPDLTFRFKNDAEKQEIIEKENESFTATSLWVNTMKQAGYEVDEKWLAERTGIPLVKVAPPEPRMPFNPMQKTRLRNLYAKI